MWDHEMCIQASSAERDSLLAIANVRVHGRPTSAYSAVCRQLVVKLSGITEWYKNGTTIEVT